MTDKTISVNRKARFEYEVLETVEAGLVLTGTEIKAMREGRANLTDAFARPHGGELWLENLHVGPYSGGNRSNHEPRRPRKLLLHREQIVELSRRVAAQGLTLVPLRLYITRHRAKVELAVAKGRKRYDKRQAIIERERAREARDGTRRRR